MFGLFVHFNRIGIGITQYVAGKFDGHALHTQADTKSRNVVFAGVLGSYELTFDTT